MTTNKKAAPKGTAEDASIACNSITVAMSPDEYARRWLYTSITRARKNLYWAPTWFAQVNQVM